MNCKFLVVFKYLLLLAYLLTSCNTILKTENKAIFKLSIKDSIFQDNSSIVIHAKTFNNSTQPIQLGSIYVLESPILSLIVWNHTGERMFTIPPGIPPVEPLDSILLAPQESYKNQYSLNIFSPTLPNGQYFVTMQNFQSDTLHFRIQEDTKN